MAEENRVIPVWFFVGVIVLIYGVLILITGIAELGNPPATVLSELHAPVWWGAVLTVVGGLFVYLFWPGRSAKGLSPQPAEGHAPPSDSRS